MDEQQQKELADLRKRLAEYDEYIGGEMLTMDHANAGAEEAARKLLEIAQTGLHPGTFGGAEMEAAAQAILALHAHIRRLQLRVQPEPPDVGGGHERSLSGEG